VQFNAVNLPITGAPSSAITVKNLLLLFRGAAAKAAQFNAASQAEAVQFNAANQAKAGARSSAANQAKAGVQSSEAAVKNLLLLCKRAAAKAAEVVQFPGANQAKAGAQSRATVVVGVAETNGAAAAHHEEGELTDRDFDY